MVNSGREPQWALVVQVKRNRLPGNGRRQFDLEEYIKEVVGRRPRSGNSIDAAGGTLVVPIVGGADVVQVEGAVDVVGLTVRWGWRGDSP